ncbi:sugar kinase [Aliivibrio fischeri]|uniref:2-dehydro-3-deoxygluconokinase n=1 Tax=Aliivibrio fischeri (strain ATCC 700601 / ES114) TaxID=312309 RepID=Q5DYT8_ALIF1|nr:sugar kinase [Aliivibrio fischeri]AAW88058.1 ketodeoxygluconokinase [Aliivibrio fischeri ES114]KLU80534.1 ketodeoxygluconokinase [Aliivibrio fischeri]MCE7536208.1 sugar kinase [Aliivibrio fischeri]MCE7554974.1 sugar kinase [Aliivibrio fischeri]MCE7558994.1 sugar kinase [Aliivibrio fischeri]
MKKTKITIIGECMIELSGNAFSTQTQSFGGDTLNTAVYLSRLLPHVSPYYLTALGQDQYSSLMLKAWEKENIDCSLVLRDQERLPGLYSINIDDKGERSFHYWRDNSAAKYMCQHLLFVPNIAKIMDADIIYLSGISLAILPTHDREILFDVLATLKKHGATIITDSNYRPRLWKNNLDAKFWLDNLYRLSDMALVTGDDEELLLDKPNMPEKEVADRLHALGVGHVVVKLGAKGAMWSTLEGKSGYVDGESVDKLVDTTAAGDSFNAAYIAAYSQGASMAESCAWGNRLASQVIQHKGAIIPMDYLQTLITDMGQINEK